MVYSVNPVYSRLCPACGGEADSNSLEKHGLCSRCVGSNKVALNIYMYNRVLDEELSDFKKFFNKLCGSDPWGAQETWVKRLLDNDNTVIIAPTGMGKTTLLIIYALYIYTRYGRKTIYLTPTKTLAKQVYDKFLKYVEKLGKKPVIIYYDSKLSRNKRMMILESIRNNQYDILVLTNNFMIRNNDLIDPNHINTIMIDDVDSLLKSSRNVRRLLRIVGYDDETIELVKEKQRILWRILLSRSMDNDEMKTQLINKLIQLENELKTRLSKIKTRQIVVASATGRIRGEYARILKELLRIDVSGITLYGRNITDTYILIDQNNTPQTIADLLSRLGSGGLILISPRHPFKQYYRDIVEKASRILVDKGYVVEEADPNSVRRFIDGETDLLIGSSSYYGISVRGIDSPTNIRYVVFMGTPLFSTDLSTLLASPNMLVRIALYLYEESGLREYREIAGDVRRRIFTLTSGEVRIIGLLLKNKITVEELDNDKLVETYRVLKQYYDKILEDTMKLLNMKRVLEINTLTLYYDGERYQALIPDTLTYIQASGRASRLYRGGMTHGLSIVVEHVLFKNLVKALDQKLGFYSGELLFKPFETIDLGRELSMIMETRTGAGNGSMKYRNILVIVESPTKARTIARFFGKPVKRLIGGVGVYEIPFMKGDEIIHLNIVASRGHLFDLTTDPGKGLYGILFNHNVMPVYDTIKRCRVCGAQFTYGDKCPRCGSSCFIDSGEVISVLRKLGMEADEIYIATDPDIEGEKIAYDIYLVLKPLNQNIWRIELHEITLREFLRALENRRIVDKKLVEAEIYRRVLDRLIGFTLSSDLWRRYDKKWLGAGRVQTPVLGWVIERYRRYRESRCRRIVYKLVDYPEIVVSINIPTGDKELYKRLLEAGEIVLKPVKTYIVEYRAKPPYATDELLYDASRLGYSAGQAMRIAQDLYESGLITYHRTSSHYVSSTGLGVAEKYLVGKGLVEYFKPSHWGEQGAHESIRPIYPLDQRDLEKAVAEGLVSPPIPLTAWHYRLYDMIFKRFIASQMKPYKAVRRDYRIIVGEHDAGVLSLDIDVVEHGYDLVVNPRIHSYLRDMDLVVSKAVVVDKRLSSTIPLYSEGDVVLEMKNNGLGRPSTYYKILESLVRHGYVVRAGSRGYLIPTKTGVSIYEYLAGNYGELVSVETTRWMEKQIDMIISGEVKPYDALVNVLEKLRGYGLIEKHLAGEAVVEAY